MDLFRSAPRRPPSTLLATPPPKRMSTPAGDRLATILENSADGPPREPAHSRHSSKTGSPRSATTWATTESKPPPPYSSTDFIRHNDPRYLGGDSEKAGFTSKLASRRGGLGRCLIIALILLIIIVALAVGLGVGLTRRNNSGAASSTNDDTSTETNDSTSFPLGGYTFVTTLRSIQTDCTSISSTWRCYPYSTSEGSNSTAGLALFNWIITASSQDFPSNDTAPATDSTGTATSLLVSTSNDPFSITLSNQSLTYINDNDNPRYTFAFTYPKVVVPSTAITSSNSATTCYFNETQFSATLYLSTSRTVDYPGAGLSDSTSVQGGYTRWPYAVQVRELATGDADTPVCYETLNGVLGEQVGNFTAESIDSQCSCNYRNFNA